jgi:hypothetical protein
VTLDLMCLYVTGNCKACICVDIPFGLKQRKIVMCLKELKTVLQCGKHVCLSLIFRYYNY